jgi:hypothetical protein
LPSREEIEGEIPEIPEKQQGISRMDSIAAELLKNGGPNLLDALHAVIL